MVGPGYQCVLIKRGDALGVPVSGVAFAERMWASEWWESPPVCGGLELQKPEKESLQDLGSGVCERLFLPESGRKTFVGWEPLSPTNEN